MPSVSASPPPPSPAAGFRLALKAFADEVCGTAARLIAYVGALVLLGILSVAIWQQIGELASMEPAGPLGWIITQVDSAAEPATSPGGPGLRGTL